MDMEKTFGENIQRARRMRKISISELAARIGTSEGRIKSFERGEVLPDMELISGIAKAMNVELRFFFEPNGDDEQKILLRRNAMPKREKAAVIELARYKSGGAVSLAIVCGLPIFSPIPKSDIDLKDARKIGSELAKEWSFKGNSISEILEAHGVFVIKIPAETGLFRGLFIYRRGVPVIALPEWEKSPREELETIAHELGHAVFLRQELPEEKEEAFCDAFGDGFSEKIAEDGFTIGKFDFVERKTVFAWKSGKMTASRAAEILEMKTDDFLKRHRNEDTL